MNLPILLFGIVLSTFYGALFHFWKGGSILRLGILIGASWVGFWVGHFIGDIAHITFWAVGALNTGMATVGSGIFLLLGDWLSLVEIKKK